MKCRNCRRVIENNSIFCNWCGAQQLKPEAEISVPRPRLLKSGSYSAQLMVHGERFTVTKETEQEYYAEARAIKAGIMLASKQPKRYTLGELIDNYIATNTNVLSPSTIRGYSIIRNHRFRPYLTLYPDSITWQGMINAEAKLCSPKTLSNAWALVCASLRAADIQPPEVNLPSVQPKELDWLDYDQIHKLLEVVRGRSVEIAVILALHSLRLSELLAVERKDVDEFIHVSKAVVFDADNILVEKGTTKTAGSTRVIPVFIQRLYDIMPESGKLVPLHPNTVYRGINRVCAEAGLPNVGVHGLRRSFASLGYHLKWSERSIMAVGGWSNIQTVHNIYIKLAQKDINVDVQKMHDYYEITDDARKALENQE